MKDKHAEEASGQRTQLTLSRRTVMKASLTAVAVKGLVGCDSDQTSVDTEYGEMAGELAGEMAGELAGEMAGELAGETAGEPAGEPMQPQPEPIPDIPPDPDPVSLFPYGVASGDPQQNSVIIWTALEASIAVGEQDSTVRAMVQYEVTDIQDLTFERPLQTGERESHSGIGFTLKVRVDELNPNTRYLYRFYFVDEQGQRTYSHIGKTRTLPDQIDEVKLAVCSCANYSSGYFHVYRHIALQDDIHAVLHLGDYIYESPSLGDETGRSLRQPVEAKDLETYRVRYAEYRLDKDLQALHRSHPMISVWDDHEFDNNAYATGSSSSTGQDWSIRKQEAKQVYHEWLPTDLDHTQPLYRRFDFGGILDLFMLDTRVEGRSEQLTRAQFNQRYDDSRQMLGDTQESWLFSSLSDSQVPWKVLGQQVMMSPLQLRGAPETERETAILLNPDGWDGYAASRQRLFDHIEAEDVSGVVVLTGDIHTSWAAELSRNPNDPLYYQPTPPSEGDPLENPKGGLAIELITPSVTSRSFELINDNIINVLTISNPQFKWYELTKKGFMKLTFTHSTLRAQWCLITDVNQVTISSLTYAKTFIIYPQSPGRMRLTEAE